MAATNSAANTEQPIDMSSAKGKGKQLDEPISQDMSMDEAESSSDESTAEEPVAEEEDDDNMEQISEDNILPSSRGGRALRNKQIDWAEAAEKAKADGEGMEDDDDDDDEDYYVPPEEDEDSRMRD